VVSLLEMTLDEEKAADQKLTEIAETVVNPDAADRDEEMGRSTARKRSTPASLAMAADRSGRATKRAPQPGRRPMRRTSTGR
jgi:hypothetical protein